MDNIKKEELRKVYSNQIKKDIVKARCPKCNVPLNKDGSHNKKFLSECDNSWMQTPPETTQGLESYNSEELFMPGWYSNTVQ